MRAEVKYFEWPDLNLRRAGSAQPESTPLVFAAGPLGEPGEETFQVTVCTPAALASMVERDGVVIGRHMLFVESIDTTRVEDTIRDRLRGLDGATWLDLAVKVGRIGLWEFEDYNLAR